jgi:hypothetical protein
VRRRFKNGVRRGGRPTILDFFERVGYRILQSARTISAQGKIDIFEAADEVENFAARYWTASRRAEMRAAAEWPIFVDQTVACFSLKHWARSISVFRDRFSAGGAKRFRGNDRFAFG